MKTFFLNLVFNWVLPLILMFVGIGLFYYAIEEKRLWLPARVALALVGLLLFLWIVSKPFDWMRAEGW